MKISGAVLTGGASRRMGRDKARIELGGLTLLERNLDVLEPLCDELLVVAREPEQYSELAGPRARLVSDHFERGGALAGLHAALSEACNDFCLVLAVDMPSVQRELLSLLVARAEDADAVVPRVGEHYEPLCAVYSRRCLPAMERQLTASEDFTILRFYNEVRLLEVPESELRAVDPQLRTFFNVNRPEDLERL